MKEITVANMTTNLASALLPQQMQAFNEFQAQSLHKKEAFWAEQAKLIDWFESWITAIRLLLSGTSAGKPTFATTR
jgi:Acetyl-coenzyme A synthetase N-terminus